MSEEEKNFIALINQNQRLIHKVCTLYETDKDAREDLFQEIVLQLWKSFCPSGSWLFHSCPEPQTQWKIVKGGTN